MHESTNIHTVKVSGSVTVFRDGRVHGPFIEIAGTTLTPTINAVEPENIIYPYLSKRKVGSFDQTVNLGVAAAVVDTLSNIFAKIDELREPMHPAHAEFNEACKSVLGFEISTFQGHAGKQAGLIVAHQEYIPLEEMGEGTSQLVGLIVRLCLAKGKIFLIEEIENDIHPKALKSLLKLIEKKSESNQFVISTHSNIVAKYLGSVPDSKVFQVSMTFQDRMPTSTIELVGDSPSDRRAVLEELGYELNDFDLWKAWLFLEESSAERIIREFLIPWFAPQLSGVLRTVSANGTSTVEPKFDDFARLFLFTHLEGVYLNRAWVILDGDEPGREIIELLRAKYKTWNPENFSTFPKPAFESYYPPRFNPEANEALAKKDKKERREAKRVLLEKVIQWAKEYPDESKEEFAYSAAEVIQVLNKLETEIV